MPSENPFLAPQIDAPATLLAPGSLAEYSGKDIKKLYHRSCNVAGVAVLLLLGAALLLALVIWAPRTEIAINVPLFLAVLSFNVVAALGAILRPAWGRVVGIIACVLLMINLNLLAILIGIMGLFAFIGAKELFGADRITHAQVKAAYKASKAKKKLR